MAGDAHPAGSGDDDGAVRAPREGTARAEQDGLTVTGNPTPRELTVVLAAVQAVGRSPTAAGSSGGPTGTAAPGGEADSGSTDAADDGTGRVDVERPDSRERIAHERRCPVCRERYDSTRPLDGATSVRTAKRGASTVCVDPGSKRVYVHSPPPG
ncbi:MAG: hypothetical protein V5A30_04745 [Haloarculaceae archaeon]